MPHDGHDHHHHDPLPDAPGGLTHWQIMEIAVRELLIEKGVLTAAEIHAQIEAMDARTPERGARMVARAWVDPAYKARALADGTAAATELGLEIAPVRLIMVENTADLHNVIVCTLCSCYPRNLLGIPPAWYKSPAYRARTVREPRAVLSEFGLTLPETVAVRVHDSTADMRYLVLPARPAGTEGMDETALAALVTRDSMIGVAVAKSP